MQATALPISIEALLRGKAVEWERLEFKRGWNPKSVLHTICAFANDFHNMGGGYVVVGIEERDGKPVLPPVGLSASKIDAIQKEILRLGNSAIQPTYHPRTVPVTFQGKTILVIWVPAGETRPYRAKRDLAKDSKEWREYIRKQSSTVMARNGDLRELVSLTATIPFDDRYSQQADIEDISTDLIEKFLKEIGSDLAEQVSSLPLEQLGQQMNVVGGSSEAPFPKNIGLMMFNKHPEKFFPASQIDIVYFPDGPGGDLIEEKEFKGPIWIILREALEYIERNYLIQTVIKHPDRAEADRIWNFAYAAIEEALANAMYHRSYEIREPVEVRITRDELVVLSYPGPDRSIKIEDIASGKAVSRRYRNRRIGEFFKELKLTEGRSTGIHKIKRAIIANGSPEPVFETDEDGSYFVVRFPVHPDAVQAIGEGSVQATEVEASGAGTVNERTVREGTPQVTPQVTPEIRRMLMAIKGESSQAEIMDRLGLKDKKNFRENYRKIAIKQALIEMTIPEKPNSRLQKYRLTDLGRQVLDNYSDNRQ